MRAVHFDGSVVQVTQRPDPEPGPDEAVVAVEWAGVCNTDLEIARGYMGFRGVLGHEWVGVVESGPADWRGRRVVGEINFACRAPDCPACRQGLGRHCPRRRVMGILQADGAFAERVAVPVANLHAVPEGLASEDAVFCEPLAAAFEILEQLPRSPSEWREQRALVLGDGKLGLLVAQVLQRAGARVLAVGRHPDKLALLARRGIETRSASDWRPEDEPFDLCVEATGSLAGFEAARVATRPRGTLVLKSTVAGRHELDLAPLVIDEIQLLGSRCGPFAPALAALAAGEIDVRSLVDDRIPLARGDDALRRAAERGVKKVLIECARG